jgi:hypothetical protein
VPVSTEKDDDSVEGTAGEDAVTPMTILDDLIEM